MAGHFMVVHETAISYSILCTLEDYNDSRQELVRQAQVLNETGKYNFKYYKKDWWRYASSSTRKNKGPVLDGNHLRIKSSIYQGWGSAKEIIPNFTLHERQVILNFPDITLASQIHDETYKTQQIQPEQLLMLNILEDAIRCLSLYKNSKVPKYARVHQDTVKWFASDDRTYIFSFVTICDVLGFNAESIRRVLATGKQIKIQNRMVLSNEQLAA